MSTTGQAPQVPDGAFARQITEAYYQRVNEGATHTEAGRARHAAMAPPAPPRVARYRDGAIAVNDGPTGRWHVLHGGDSDLPCTTVTHATLGEGWTELTVLALPDPDSANLSGCPTWRDGTGATWTASAGVVEDGDGRAHGDLDRLLRTAVVILAACATAQARTPEQPGRGDSPT